MQLPFRRSTLPSGECKLPFRRSILPSEECNFRSEDRFSRAENATSVQKIDLPSGECKLPFKRSILLSGECNFRSKDQFSRAENANFRSKDRLSRAENATSVQKIDSPERRIQLAFECSIPPSGGPKGSHMDIDVSNCFRISAILSCSSASGYPTEESTELVLRDLPIESQRTGSSPQHREFRPYSVPLR